MSGDDARMKRGGVHVTFGRRVRALRIEQGLTQEAVAHRAGISTAYLSDIERGLRNPSLANINKLAKVFGISLADLFAGVR